MERLGDEEARRGDGCQQEVDSNRANGRAWPEKCLDTGGETGTAEGSRHRERTADVTSRDTLDGKNGFGDEQGILKSPGRFRIGGLFTGKAQVVEKASSDRRPVEEREHGRDRLPKDVPAALVRRFVLQDRPQESVRKAPAERVGDDHVRPQHPDGQGKRRRRANPRHATGRFHVGIREKGLQHVLASSQRESVVPAHDGHQRTDREERHPADPAPGIPGWMHQTEVNVVIGVGHTVIPNADPEHREQ